MLAVGTQLLLPGIGSGIAGLIGKTAIGAKVFGGLAYAGSQLSAGVSTLTQFAGLAGKVGVSTPITAYGSTLAGEAFAAAGLGDVYGFASIASAGINGGFGSGNGFNGEQFATSATYAAAGLGASKIGGIGGFAFSTALGSAQAGHFVVQTPSFAGFALTLGLQPITVESYAAIQTQDAKKSAGRPVAGDEPKRFDASGFDGATRIGTDGVASTIPTTPADGGVQNAGWLSYISRNIDPWAVNNFSEDAFFQNLKFLDEDAYRFAKERIRFEFPETGPGFLSSGATFTPRLDKDGEVMKGYYNFKIDTNSENEYFAAEQFIDKLHHPAAEGMWIQSAGAGISEDFDRWRGKGKSDWIQIKIALEARQQVRRAIARTTAQGAEYALEAYSAVIPGMDTLLAGSNAVEHAKNDEWGAAVLDSVGLLPVIPGAAVKFKNAAGETLDIASDVFPRLSKATAREKEAITKTLDNWKAGKIDAPTAQHTLKLIVLQKSCFVAGTPVLTCSGSKSIESLRPGDKVLTRPESNPDAPVLEGTVERLIELRSPTLVIKAGGQAFETTPEHPFHVVNRGWVAAEELAVGDELTGASVSAAIESIEPGQSEVPVFNLTVSHDHTYFVGQSEEVFAAWVHNDYKVVKNSTGKQYSIVDEDTGETLFNRIDSPEQAQKWIKNEFDPADAPLSYRVQPYKDATKQSTSLGLGQAGYEANHLNQTAAFTAKPGDQLPGGLSNFMEGSINDGLAHGIFHNSLNKNLWSKYRGTDLTPTGAQYDAALRQALQDSGYTPHEVGYFAALARDERINVYGIGEQDFLPRVPSK